MSLSGTFVSNLELVRGLASRADASARHQVSSTEVTASITTSELPGLRLSEFAAGGNHVTVSVASGDDYVARFVADSTPRFECSSQTGSLDSVAKDSESATDAIRTSDFQRLARAIVNPTVVVIALLRKSGDDPEFVWAEDVILRAGVGGWVGPAQVLATRSDIVVLSAEGDALRTGSLLIQGPKAGLSIGRSLPRIRDYEGVRIAEPRHYLPLEVNGLDRIADLLRRITIAVTWAEIATRVHAQSEPSRQGSPDLMIRAHVATQFGTAVDQLPKSDEEASRAFELWDWITTSEDYTARLEAARQVAAPIVRSVSDLEGAAAVVLREARFVHDLSRRSAVAAMVEARKAAWSGARQAAALAAAEARTSARSTADRTVAAVIASFAVVITHKSEVLDVPISILVLFAVIAGVVAAGAYAFHFEFPATRRAFDAALSELRTTHRDVLLREDVDEILDGPVVKDSRETIRRATRTAWWSLTVAALSVVVALGVVAGTRGGTGTSTPGPPIPTRTTTVQGPSAPSPPTTTP